MTNKPVTTTRYEELSRAARRRMVTAALLRAAASTALLLVGYYLAPLDRSVDTATLIGFLIGLLIVAAVIAWQVRAIVASDYPRLRAVQAVAIGLPLLLLLFAGTYVLLSTARPGSFNDVLGHTDALYFTVTVFATVGFGDIVPVSDAARILVMIQMIMGLVTVGVVAKILLGAVQVAERRRETQAPGSAGTDDPPGAGRSGDKGSTRAGGS